MRPIGPIRHSEYRSLGASVCPHCHKPIEIVTDAGNGEVVCPSCGSTFRVDAESTGSWRSLRGHQLGRFELIESVGSGAFGTV
jgi:uncharacterized Zn finger protein (UPF0148 family)